MSSPRSSHSRAVLIASLAVAGACLALGGQPRSPGQLPVAPQEQPITAAAAEERPSDQAAVRKAIDGLVAAFRKGDAKAMAACWTAEGEYTNDGGATFRGRPALEKAYAEFFTKNPNHHLDVEVASVRFPSRDTAVAEGHFKLRWAKSADLAVSKCSFLFAREDGKWLIAIAREEPGDGLSLRDLEWLIGTWEAKQIGVIVGTTYEWTKNKSFIRCRFSITRGGTTTTGMQMIGKDPATGALRVWSFEDEGGIGDTEIGRDGKKWAFFARGVTTEGRVLTATNLMTPIDADAFTWHSVERALDGEPLPDLPPVKVVRVKAK